jgi:hypothetical protein
VFVCEGVVKDSTYENCGFSAQRLLACEQKKEEKKRLKVEQDLRQFVGGQFQ